MNAVIKNKLVSKKIYKKLSLAIKPLGAVQQKLTAIKEKNKEKSEMESITCLLTGALNREGLSKLFDKIVPSALKKVSIIYIEIDHVDEVQQKISKNSFDKLLQKFVTEVNLTCRNTDIISRWSSKDFILVCPESTLKEAEAVAFEIRGAIRNNVKIKGLNISCSTGVTQVFGIPLHELIFKTKQSIYRIKNKSTNKSYVAKLQTFEKETKANQMTSSHTSNILPTGVLNRVDVCNFLDKVAPEDLERTSVVFVELIGLDEIYKKHGQRESREVLKSFVEEVQKTGRPYDTFAQWGPTEYVLVCPSTTVYRAFDVAKEIQSSIQNRVWKNNITITCNTDVYDPECINENTYSIKENQSVIEMMSKRIEVEKTKSVAIKPTNPGIDRAEMICSETGLLNRIGLGDYFDNQDAAMIQNTSVVFIDVDYCGVAYKNFAKNVTNNILKDIIEEINDSKENAFTLGRWSENEYMLICPETPIEKAKSVTVETRLVLQNRAWLKDINITCQTELWDQSCESISGQLPTGDCPNKEYSEDDSIFAA